MRSTLERLSRIFANKKFIRYLCYDLTWLIRLWFKFVFVLFASYVPKAEMEGGGGIQKNKKNFKGVFRFAHTIWNLA